MGDLARTEGELRLSTEIADFLEELCSRADAEKAEYAQKLRLKEEKLRKKRKRVVDDTFVALDADDLTHMTRSVASAARDKNEAANNLPGPSSEPHIARLKRPRRTLESPPRAGDAAPAPDGDDGDHLDGGEDRSELRAGPHNEDENDTVDAPDSVTTRTLRPRLSLTSGLPPCLRARRCEQDEGVASTGSHQQVTEVIRDEPDALRSRDEEDRAPESQLALTPRTRARGPTTVECEPSTVNSGENCVDSEHLDEILPRRTRGRLRKHPIVSISESDTPVQSSSSTGGALATTVDDEENCAGTSERTGSVITHRRRGRAKKHSVVITPDSNVEDQPRRRGSPRKQLLEAAVEDQSRRRGSHREQLLDAALEDPPRIGRLRKQPTHSSFGCVGLVQPLSNGDARVLSGGDASQAQSHGVESLNNTAPTSADGTLTESGEREEAVFGQIIDGGEGNEADVLLPPQSDNPTTAATCGWNDIYRSLVLNGVLPPLVALDEGTTLHGPSDSPAPPSSLALGTVSPSLTDASSLSASKDQAPTFQSSDSATTPAPFVAITPSAVALSQHDSLIPEQHRSRFWCANCGSTTSSLPLGGWPATVETLVRLDDGDLS
ncbi:hypothetical protein DFH06DRAFT_1320097 [Mycena polygramma]|nr:hypothetical protein DFH06DRAFT_1320097 [Mycena polygramma]